MASGKSIITWFLFVLAMTAVCNFAVAGTAYQYRAPDGSIVFTGEPLELPFELVKKMELDWGDVKAQEITAKMPKKREPDKKAKRKNRPKFADLIEEKADKYKLLPELVHAVIEAESAYDPNAVSHAGAVGLMQLMPKTAERFGVTDRTDPEQSIEGGTAYLRELLDLFDNDLTLAIAGYNAGEGAVIKYGRTIPPYKETQHYVPKVLRFMRRNLKKSREASTVATTSKPFPG